MESRRSNTYCLVVWRSLTDAIHSALKPRINLRIRTAGTFTSSAKTVWLRSAVGREASVWRMLQWDSPRHRACRRTDSYRKADLAWETSNGTFSKTRTCHGLLRSYWIGLVFLFSDCNGFGAASPAGDLVGGRVAVSAIDTRMITALDSVDI